MNEQIRILIVEDEEMNIDMLSRRLRKAGYEVATAMNGIEALEVIAQRPIDMVLLDQMMPGMSGLQVLDQLRSNPLTHDLPVIMVTALADGASVAEALDRGADDYVTKPLDFKIALARIRALASRHQDRRQQQKREERYQLAMLSGGNIIIDCDLLNDLVYYSPEWYQMLGYEPDGRQHTREECISRVHPADLPSLMESMQGCVHPVQVVGDPSRTQYNFSAEFRLRHQNGSYRWVTLKGTTVVNAEGKMTRQIAFLNDITEKKTRDAATGLPNLIQLEQEYENAKATHVSFSLLLFEIERFKLIEESLGPDGRDTFVQQVCRRAQSALSEYKKLAGELPPDLRLARVGNDEFVLWSAPGISLESTTELAAFLVHAMRQDFAVDGRAMVCSIRLGLVENCGESTTLQEMIHDARTAVYAARLQGNTAWKVFDPSMRELHEDRLQLEFDLRVALPRKEFEVYYQSRVELKTGRICGFEALIRWNHPVRGIVPPTQFIPLAEEAGLVHEIGLWVLRTACTQLQEWRKNYSLPQDFEVSVNFSASQCRQTGLVEDVSQILRETGLPPANLNLELTESILLDNLAEAHDVLQSLRNLGIGMKMDDFGTGYSSLKYLCELPFDCLKIDRSFVSDLGLNNPESVAMIETILQLAHNLNMETVAEGVETATHAELLKNMGCEFGQGYFYSRPLRAKDAELLLKANLLAFSQATGSTTRSEGNME
ncbi:putative bifunctional diguanylate cyclase/phosphodiesterase [Telmatobacter bradus]|uniref:putative bifunctional diguanylate cyclase/phosphodiesterase n=1 Tax=Telmatobacter bradus TaxID=474953 RepID=UPI003B42FC66